MTVTVTAAGSMSNTVPVVVHAALGAHATVTSTGDPSLIRGPLMLLRPRPSRGADHPPTGRGTDRRPGRTLGTLTRGAADGAEDRADDARADGRPSGRADADAEAWTGDVVGTACGGADIDGPPGEVDAAAPFGTRGPGITKCWGCTADGLGVVRVGLAAGVSAAAVVLAG